MSPTPGWTRFLCRGEWQLVWAGAFALCEWGHLLLERTTQSRSFDWLDDSLHVVGIPLKILTLVCLPIMLSGVLARCHRDARTAGLVGVGWLLSALVLLGGLSAARETLGRWLSNSQDKFYPVTQAALDAYNARGYDLWGNGAALFLARWRSGEILRQEALLLSVAVLGLVAIGYFLGRLSPGRTGLAVAWLVLVLFVGKFAFRMADFQADTFLAGTLMGPLFHDVLVPIFPMSAVSPITSLAYLLMLGTPRLTLRGLGSQGPDGLDPGAHASAARGEAGQGA